MWAMKEKFYDFLAFPSVLTKLTEHIQGIFANDIAILYSISACHTVYNVKVNEHIATMIRFTLLCNLLLVVDTFGTGK